MKNNFLKIGGMLLGTFSFVNVMLIYQFFKVLYL